MRWPSLWLQQLLLRVSWYGLWLDLPSLQTVWVWLEISGKHQEIDEQPSLWSFFKLLTNIYFTSVQSLSRAQLLCDPMNLNTPGFPVHHLLPEFTQTHVHWVGDAIQPSHPLSSPSPPALNLYQHQGLFQWVSSLHQMAKVLEFQLQHQSFQWTPRTDLF